MRAWSRCANYIGLFLSSLSVPPDAKFTGIKQCSTHMACLFKYSARMLPVLLSLMLALHRYQPDHSISLSLSQTDMHTCGMQDSTHFPGYEEDPPQARGSPEGFLGLGNLYPPALIGGKETASKVCSWSISVLSLLCWLLHRLCRTPG